MIQKRNMLKVPKYIIKNGINRHAILKDYEIGNTKYSKLYTHNKKYRIITIYYKLSFIQIMKLLVNRGRLYQQYLNVDNILEIPTNVISLVPKPIVKNIIHKVKTLIKKIFNYETK